MFNGKMKAVTFSYDDGVTQDIRLIQIFNKYGLKATFNLNSELLGLDNALIREGQTVNHTKIQRDQVREVYLGHEVAAHTLTHPLLTQLDETEIVKQVEEDRRNLEAIVGYDVVGMAYPGGGVNNNDYVANVIRNQTAIQYARTTTSTYHFDLQDNLFRFNPTVYHHQEWGQMEKLAEAFIALKPDKPQIFYIWGHSYEFDIHNSWDKFEQFCQRISGHDDIFYGTNREVILPDYIK
ncbi:polysaccharide deacetylase family protein [Paenibacillus sp. LMG 31461]|uniref:Polysaccharide deacetylase family protein n=1 Tax=Paenibacillus plantarum TaxID=2654975 RepID=A0ABX1X2Z4_9BACL|nr:polysaccharide deacetylase family protein [Paenibacillus plantarum]NOU62694.1 polysaccharide deacetylase family protein [Paenibacillus plantarum]